MNLVVQITKITNAAPTSEPQESESKQKNKISYKYTVSDGVKSIIALVPEVVFNKIVSKFCIFELFRKMRQKFMILSKLMH